MPCITVSIISQHSLIPLYEGSTGWAGSGMTQNITLVCAPVLVPGAGTQFPAAVGGVAPPAKLWVSHLAAETHVRVGPLAGLVVAGGAPPPTLWRVGGAVTVA